VTSIDVIGGVYGEGCAFPNWNEIYGSAGRAAAGLSSHFDQVTLHSVSPKENQRQITPIFHSYDIDVEWHDGEQFIGFDYLHCLADPTISPSIPRIKQQPSFHVNADLAVIFGMMECTPSVKAKTCVYDPQSPIAPKGFKASGSVADRLAFVANANEIRKLTGKSIDEGAMEILATERAEIVIAKCGLEGARIFGSVGKIGSVPAFKTKNVFTIGSGDVFVAAFALAWGAKNMSPLASARYASLAVADFVEKNALPILSIGAAKETNRTAVKLKGGEVYLAGPFRELGQRVTINEARKILHSLGLNVFSPVHDIGHGPAETVVKLDLEALDKCDCVLAILKGSSPGTVFEVGYAAAKGKPVYCVAQNMRKNDLKLPQGVGAIIHDDFVSALHLLAWRE